MKVLVTGANGFVGNATLLRLIGMSGVTAIGSVRRSTMFADAGVLLATVDELSARTDWSGALPGVQTVVHTAARVHCMQDVASDPLEEFRRVNVQGTLNLARQAAAAGVQRFVFISSIKVNGESTQLNSPFTADDAPAPRDAYSVSKMEAEQGLRELTGHSDMEVVIIRPPLVYGPGVKDNFAAMMRWLQRGVPLPLGAVHNKRSLVALDNLVDLIVLCLSHPLAANKTFLVSDGEDVSTTELLRGMARALEISVNLIPVPQNWIKLAAFLVGELDVAQRLCGSLQVDITETRELLGWKPLIPLDEGLRRAARCFE